MKAKRTIITDGINSVERSTPQPEASVKDVLALLKAKARPKETLAEEVDSWARELEEQLAGVAEQNRTAVQQCIAEARYMASAAPNGVSVFTPGQVRELLKQARWLVYQGKAAPLVARAKAQSKSQSERRKGTGTDHERVRRYHARLMARGDHDATSQTATEFGLSTRQVRNILNPSKTDRK